MHNHIPAQQPPSTSYPAGATPRRIWDERMRQLARQDMHESRVRAALQALHAYRTGDLTQGERNALLGRAKEHMQAGGSPMAWVRVQDLLIQDVLAAAEAAGWLA